MDARTHERMKEAELSPSPTRFLIQSKAARILLGVRGLVDAEHNSTIDGNMHSAHAHTEQNIECAK